MNLYTLVCVHVRSSDSVFKGKGLQIITVALTKRNLCFEKFAAKFIKIGYK